MLELKDYSVQEIENLKDLFLVFYVIIDAIRKEIGKYLGYTQSDIFIVDSMPIPVCGCGRTHFGK